MNFTNKKVPFVLLILLFAFGLSVIFSNLYVTTPAPTTYLKLKSPEGIVVTYPYTAPAGTVVGDFVDSSAVDTSGCTCGTETCLGSPLPGISVEVTQVWAGNPAPTGPGVYCRSTNQMCAWGVPCDELCYQPSAPAERPCVKYCDCGDQGTIGVQDWQANSHWAQANYCSNIAAKAGASQGPMVKPTTCLGTAAAGSSGTSYSYNYGGTTNGGGSSGGGTNTGGGGTVITIPTCTYLSCENANSQSCNCGTAQNTATNPWCCAADSSTYSNRGACQTNAKCAVTTTTTTTTTTTGTEGTFNGGKVTCTEIQTNVFRCSVTYTNNLGADTNVVFEYANENGNVVSAPESIAPVSGQTVYSQFHCSTYGSGDYTVSWIAYKGSDFSNSVDSSKSNEMATITC